MDQTQSTYQSSTKERLIYFARTTKYYLEI